MNGALRVPVAAYLGLLVALPVAVLAWRGLADGVGPFLAAVRDPTAVDALGLSLWTSGVAAGVNAVSGLAFLLLFGRTGILRPVLGDAQVAFAVPGVLIATLFVTLPFTLREVALVLAELGDGEEQAAATLGASAWQTFHRVTLPDIRGGLVIGATLTLARALGEFGAVLLVGGGIAHRTQTATTFIHAAVEERQEPAACGMALLGPSGGGKSTILRIIAGLDRADGGEVWLDGRRVDHIHARARQVGFVFQHYALFRHMTVGENIAFGLDVQGASALEKHEQVATLLGIMGLRGLGDRTPSQLSGGQRQRVALARALAPRPKLLLLDEPFGAVDAKVREELRRWLRKLHDEVHTTSIFVTHDQEEAFAIADRVLIVQGGRLEQDGAPTDILDEPATEFVARFVGEVNVFAGEARHGEARFGPLTVPSGIEGRVHVVIRAYDLKFWREAAGVATVRRVLPVGDRVRVEADLDGGAPIFAQFPRRSSLLNGIEAGCRIAVEVTHARAWPAE